MERAIADIVIVTVGVTILSGSALLGYWLSLRHRRRMTEIAAASSADLLAELEALRTELTGQIEDIQGRLDFAERLLAQERSPERLKAPEPKRPEPPPP